MALYAFNAGNKIDHFFHVRTLVYRQQFYIRVVLFENAEYFICECLTDIRHAFKIKHYF